MSHPFHTFGHPKPVATGLLLIDYRVEHREPFLALASADLQIRVLTPGEDALQVLLDEAAPNAPGHIHLVAHGKAGELQLGGEAWDSGLVDREAARLAQLGALMEEDAARLLYGCEVGHGSAGRAFVAALQAATGVAVAAASGPVGAAALGANWLLDVGQHDVAALSVPEWSGRLGLVSLADPPYRGWSGSSEAMQFFAAAAIRADDSVVTWGNKDFGGDSSQVANLINGVGVKVVSLYAAGSSLAALRADGSVIARGDAGCGGATVIEPTSALRSRSCR